jgi:hypothetical protein
MTIFNKQGVEFTHPICVPEDPNFEPTYRFKFPTIQGGRVVERWARKVRPIKDLTAVLRGCNLTRYKDYMVEYADVKAGHYTYWFLDSRHATMFALIASTLTQTTNPKGPQFGIVCPHCQSAFPTDQITWI